MIKTKLATNREEKLLARSTVSFVLMNFRE